MDLLVALRRRVTTDADLDELTDYVTAGHQEAPIQLPRQQALPGVRTSRGGA